MVDVSGDFELHLSVYAHAAGKLADFAEQHGVKLVHECLPRSISTSSATRPSGTPDDCLNSAELPLGPG
jgi:hypothetical protein